jgi:hypothetical protein
METLSTTAMAARRTWKSLSITPTLLTSATKSTCSRLPQDRLLDHQARHSRLVRTSLAPAASHGTTIHVTWAGEHPRTMGQMSRLSQPGTSVTQGVFLWLRMGQPSSSCTTATHPYTTPSPWSTPRISDSSSVAAASQWRSLAGKQTRRGGTTRSGRRMMTLIAPSQCFSLIPLGRLHLWATGIRTLIMPFEMS